MHRLMAIRVCLDLVFQQAQADWSAARLQGLEQLPRFPAQSGTVYVALAQITSEY